MPEVDELSLSVAATYTSELDDLEDEIEDTRQVWNEEKQRIENNPITSEVNFEIDHRSLASVERQIQQLDHRDPTVDVRFSSDDEASFDEALEGESVSVNAEDIDVSSQQVDLVGDIVEFEDEPYTVRVRTRGGGTNVPSTANVNIRPHTDHEQVQRAFNEAGPVDVEGHATINDFDVNEFEPIRIKAIAQIEEVIGDTHRIESNEKTGQTVFRDKETGHITSDPDDTLPRVDVPGNLDITDVDESVGQIEPVRIKAYLDVEDMIGRKHDIVNTNNDAFQFSGPDGKFTTHKDEAAFGPDPVTLDGRIDATTIDMDATRVNVDGASVSGPTSTPTTARTVSDGGFRTSDLAQSNTPFTGGRMANFDLAATHARDRSVNPIARQMMDGPDPMRRGMLGRMMSVGSAFMPSDRDSLFDTLDKFDIGMADIYEIVADLVPLFGVFVGALPAAIGGVVALAGAAIAAAGALAGVGALALAGMELAESGAIEEELQQLVETTKDAFADTASQLAGLGRDIFDEINALIETIGAQSSMILSFEDDFRGLMNYLSGAIPEFLAFAAQLAEQGMPQLRALAEIIADADLGEGMLSFLTRVGPMILTAVNEIISLIKFITQLSIGFLQMANSILIVINSIGSFLMAIQEFLNMPILPFLGAGIGMLLVFATAVGLVATILPPLITLGQAVGGAMLYMASSSYTLSGAMNAVTTSAALATAAIVTFLSVITLGVGGALIGTFSAGVGGMSTEFSNLADQVSGATSELENFSDAQDDIGDSTFGGSGVGDSSSKYVEFTEVDNTVVAKNEDELDKKAAALRFDTEYDSGKSDDSAFGS